MTLKMVSVSTHGQMEGSMKAIGSKESSTGRENTQIMKELRRWASGERVRKKSG